MNSSQFGATALALALMAGWSNQANAQQSATDPVQRAATLAPKAQQAVMLALASAGKRLVAAGERGVILLSDDGGAHWTQAQVPVAVTLTALSFPTPKAGWAVGHGGVVLHSADGGSTWKRQLDGRQAAAIELDAAKDGGSERDLQQARRLVADGPDKPLLAVHFWDAQRGLVIGAYGAAYVTADGGKSWSSWRARIDNPQGMHLNALYTKGNAIYLAGEQGLILRSRDAGNSFEQLRSPYRGSWFSIAAAGQRLMLAGLRGNLYWSDDEGQSWESGTVDTPVTISQLLVTRDNALVAVNQAGKLLASPTAGQQLRQLPPMNMAPVTAIVQAHDGALIAATFAGPQRLSVNEARLVRTSP